MLLKPLRITELIIAMIMIMIIITDYCSTFYLYIYLLIKFGALVYTFSINVSVLTLDCCVSIVKFESVVWLCYALCTPESMGLRSFSSLVVWCILVVELVCSMSEDFGCSWSHQDLSIERGICAPLSDKVPEVPAQILNLLGTIRWFIFFEISCGSRPWLCRRRSNECGACCTFWQGQGPDCLDSEKKPEF